MTTDNFDGDFDARDKTEMDVLHEIGSRIAAADPLHAVLGRVVDFVSSIVPCDSCFMYVLEEDDLEWWHLPDEGFAGRKPLPRDPA